MGWWEWLNLAVTALLLVGVVAWLCARRAERREHESARRRREQRLADWRFIEWPETPQTFPEPGTTRLDEALTSRLSGSDDFEELRTFFGAYFHQDWDLDDEDEDGVIRRYVEDGRPPARVAEMLYETDELLALGLSDGDLQEALAALGSEYYADTHTNTWLRTLRAKVAAEAKDD